MTNRSTLSILGTVFGIALLAFAGWFWSQRGATELVAPSGAASSPPVDNVAAAAPANTNAAASAPPALFPVEQAASDPSSARFDFVTMLSGLIGSKAAAGFLQTADFPRRVVATVDNLGRSHAPPSSWPVNPTAGRFLIDERDGRTVINSGNAERYVPLVRLIEAVDIKQLAKIYTMAYPMLQQAYEDIGYPNRYFNDRFVEVIDQLLATPEAPEPLAVHLTEVKGPLVSTRPWVRYEFLDSSFEQLSSGQKIMLRIGADNRRRLKTRLVEWRRELTRSPGPR